MMHDPHSVRRRMDARLPECDACGVGLTPEEYQTEIERGAGELPTTFFYCRRCIEELVARYKAGQDIR